MTERRFRAKVKVMARNIQADVVKECLRLWNSGAIDKKGPDAELAPRACVHIALKKMACTFRPLSTEGKSMSKNLGHF